MLVDLRDDATVGAPGSTGWALLARPPEWRRWAATSLLARVAPTATVVGFATAGKELTGHASDGIVLGSGALFLAALLAPFAGRTADRRGAPQVLSAAMAVAALALATAAVVVATDAPYALLAIAAAVHGVALSPVQGCLRATGLATMPADRALAVTSAEAVLIEVAFIVGPGLAALAATVVAPEATPAAMAVCAAVAAGLSTRLRGAAPVATIGSTPVLRRLRPVLAAAFTGGLALGAVQASSAVLAERAGASTGAGGYLYATAAVGGVLGGVAAVRIRALAGWRAPAWLVLGAASLIATAAATPMPLLLAALLVVGAPIAPLNTAGMSWANARAGDGRRAEAGASYFGALSLGVGCGGLLSGTALDHLGPAAVLTAAAVLIGVLSAVVQRRASGDPHAASTNQPKEHP